MPDDGLLRRRVARFPEPGTAWPTLAVIGLGYVGLPIAVAFARHHIRVIGFDIDASRIRALASGVDRSLEVPPEELAEAKIEYTSDAAELKRAEIFIVTVPTPLTEEKRPDLGPLLAASEIVGRSLRLGSVIVYESTVYPGATQEECIPTLERVSGLRAGKDFFVGYSPERINPGDPLHRLQSITKVVAAEDPETLGKIADLYGRVVRSGIYKASSIRVAEAAKVIENAQRDLNIAFVNELACIFDRLGLDTREVLEVAATKWNFMLFSPGLVGGHCIGVDPFYLTHLAERAGYHPEVILAGRRINDSMGSFIARRCVRMLMTRGVVRPTVTVLGATFKENVPDLRNSPIRSLVRELLDHGIVVQLVDPLASPDLVHARFGLGLTAPRHLRPADAVIVAVAHDSFVAAGWPFIQRCLTDGSGSVLDVKGVLDREAIPQPIDFWRL